MPACFAVALFGVHLSALKKRVMPILFALRLSDVILAVTLLLLTVAHLHLQTYCGNSDIVAFAWRSQ